MLHHDYENIAHENRIEKINQWGFIVLRLIFAFTTFTFGWDHGHLLFGALPSSVLGVSVEWIKHLLGGLVFTAVLDGLAFWWSVVYEYKATSSKQRTISKNMAWVNLTASVIASMTYGATRLFAEWVPAEMLTGLSITAICILLLVAGSNMLQSQAYKEADPAYLDKELANDTKAEAQNEKRKQARRMVKQALSIVPNAMAEDVPQVAKMLAGIWRNETLADMGYAQEPSTQTDETEQLAAVVAELQKMIAERLPDTPPAVDRFAAPLATGYDMSQPSVNHPRYKVVCGPSYVLIKNLGEAVALAMSLADGTRTIKVMDGEVEVFAATDKPERVPAVVFTGSETEQYHIHLFLIAVRGYGLGKYQIDEIGRNIPTESGNPLPLNGHHSS